MQNKTPKFPLRSAFFVVAISLLIGCNDTPKENKVGSQAKIEVTVEFQFNGRKDDQSVTVKCPDGSCVIDALQTACEEASWEIQTTGTGETAFVQSINGVVNEKGAGDNWTYRVNSKLAKLGSGVKKLVEGDRITWSFGKYELE